MILANMLLKVLCYLSHFHGYEDHINDLLLWYKFDGNTNNHINDIDKNLYILSGKETYGNTMINNTNSLYLDGSTSYLMGQYNNAMMPSGINYADNSGLTISFWINPTVNGKRYIFSYTTSNLLSSDSTIESYLINNNIYMSISKNNITTSYTLPIPLQYGIYYNISWVISKNINNATNIDGLWSIYLNGIKYYK